MARTRLLDKMQASGVRKYTVDPTVYERGLTADSAWLMGVIVGDGCVIRKHGVVQGLEVCGDEDVCRKAAVILGSNHPVKHLQGGCYALRVYSRRLGRSLAAHGIGPAKTETVRLPSIPDDLVSHMVRGYWDADGCVTTKTQQKQRGGKKQLVLSAKTVSLGLANDVVGVLQSVVDGSYGPYGKRKKLVAASCLKAVRIGDWMWADSQPWNRGSRKHMRFRELRCLHG